MQPTDPTTPGFQLSDWRDAVALLGGQRAAARALGISEKTLRSLHSGARRLHEGYLRDMAAALLDHADACRRAEKKLTPAFSANLTAEQRRKLERHTPHPAHPEEARRAVSKEPS